MFTPEHSLLRRSILLRPPGQPPDQARLPPCPPPYPSCNPTLPATPPCPPPHPASLPSLAVLPASVATTASRALQRASAVLVLMQLLCVWGASQRATPSNILYTPSYILCTPSKIVHTPSKSLCTPSKILRTRGRRTPSNILHKSYL